MQTSKMPATVPLGLMPDATLELDGDGRVAGANDLALEMFGYADGDLEGQPGARLLPVDELFARAGSGAARCVKLVGRRANGTPFPVEATVRPIDAGGTVHVLCAVRELDDDALVGEAQRYFDVAFDDAPIGMALFNCDGEYVRVNAALCELLGRPPHELIGRRDQELTHPDDRQADLDAAWAILEGAYSTHQCEKRFVRPDGSIVWALANLTFLRDEAGRPLSWVGQFQDITARRAAEHATRNAEERFRLAFDHAPIGIALVGPDGRWLRVNRRLCEMTGYAEDELLTATFQDITHPDDLDADLEHVRAMLAGEVRTYETEKRYVRADGSVMWILLFVSLVRDHEDRPLYFISQIQDIDDRRRAHGELERLAHHDALTGVPNRRAWDTMLERAIGEARHTGRPLAVALIDLNDFKAVNDNHGHDAGDRLLEQATAAWQRELRATDVLARIGGDEFAVLLPDCGAEDVDGVVCRLRSGLTHAPGCAVGVALWREADGAGDLMRRADEALYADKRSLATARVAPG